ncbi:MAG: hypothetical protein QM669_05595 [Siphonobacter sp.]
MKTRFLFPHWCKRLGWMLSLFFLSLGVLFEIRDAIWSNETIDTYTHWLNVKIPKRMVWDEDGFLSKSVQSPYFENNLLDEIIIIGLVAGLLLLAFSKEKTEDEWVARIRLESLQWGVIINTVLILMATLFIYDGPYFWVLVYNIFTTLIIFITRFNWLLYIRPALGKSREQVLS